MCDPVSLITIGGAVGLGSWGIGEIANYQAQGDLNESIEERYQQDLENARRERLALEGQQHEKALQDNQETHREEREVEREQMITAAQAEAAMSSLNIAGNTAQRQVVTGAIAETENAGAFDAKQERIEGGFRSGVRNVDRQYSSALLSAENTAMASWRPLTGQWYTQIMGALGSTVSGMGTGASMGEATKGLKWDDIANAKIFQGDTYSSALGSISGIFGTKG